MKQLNIMVGVTLIILVAFSVTCQAQGGPIYGCIQKNNGQLRIVNDENSCKPSEKLILWNNAETNTFQAKDEEPKVYDANGQFLGILPNTWDGFLSVFIPSLGKFIIISPENGDISPFYPAAYLYFDDDNCMGNAYVDINMRYQVLKVGSKYIVAEEVASECMDIKSISTPDWGNGSQCLNRSSVCIPVLPYREIELPFTMPVALPLYFGY